MCKTYFFYCMAMLYFAALCIEVLVIKVVCIYRIYVCRSVQMRRLLQQLQQRWLLRSLVQELRTVPISYDARPCFPREPLLPLPPPLPALARAQWRFDSCILLLIFLAYHYWLHWPDYMFVKGEKCWLCPPKEQGFCDGNKFPSYSLP